MTPARGNNRRSPDRRAFRGRPPQRRRSRRRARIQRRRRLPFVVLTAFGAVLLMLVAGGFTGATIVLNNCKLSALQAPGTNANSFIYAADHSLLGAIPSEKNRKPVSRSEMSPWLAKATVAIEDRRFYQHGGIDPRGIARALYRDVKAGRAVEGGSTITQQLVRNLYISPEQTVNRKLKEICLAQKLAKVWSRDKILSEYMNQVYYGSHAYGVEAAAQTYFSKPSRHLSISESALIAGLPQAPSDYDPFVDARKALARRDEVLKAMLESGYINQAQYEDALAEKIHLKAGRLFTHIREPYFFSYVRDALIQQYGAATVRSGGLKVYTTIDPRLQRLAKRAIKEQFPYKSDPAAAVVSIDPRNGAIRAMAAETPGRSGNQFNLVAQAKRQAGSTFKTFVLAAAIERGINPETSTYVSAPFYYPPLKWPVHTYDNTYGGTTTIERALLRSDNSVFAQLTVDVGAENVAEMARRLGVKTRLWEDDGEFAPALGLGAKSVSPLEMASAYATIAAGGIYSKPISILKVEFANGTWDRDTGWGKPQRVRVVEDWVAAEVTKILGENIHYGTAAAAELGRPDAAKTGTTENHADAWLCGYTPNLSTTVWVGYPQAEIPMVSVHGISVTGGSFPALIWHSFMLGALDHVREYDFPKAKSAAVWKPFHRGVYAISGDYYPAPTTTTSATTTTAGDRSNGRPPTTTREQVVTETTPTVEEIPTVTDTTPLPPPVTTVSTTPQ